MLPLLTDGLRHVFQRGIIENKPDIISNIQEVWGVILDCVSPEVLAQASVPWLGVWLCLLMQPHNLPFDQNLLIQAEHVVRVRSGRQRCPTFPIFLLLWSHFTYFLEIVPLLTKNSYF